MPTEIKMSELPAASSANGTMEFETNDSGTSKKVTGSQLKTFVNDDITNPGDLTFTGTGNRITGDFSNATVADRVSFQSSTANGNTVVNFIPNGTGNNAVLELYNGSDPANASLLQYRINDTITQLNSTLRGTGTYLPMTFATGGLERMRVTSSGGVSFGSSGTAYGTTGQVLTSQGNAPPTWTTPVTTGKAIAMAIVFGG